MLSYLALADDGCTAGTAPGETSWAAASRFDGAGEFRALAHWSLKRRPSPMRCCCCLTWSLKAGPPSTGAGRAMRFAHFCRNCRILLELLRGSSRRRRLHRADLVLEVG